LKANRSASALEIAAFATTGSSNLIVLNGCCLERLAERTRLERKHGNEHSITQQGQVRSIDVAKFGLRALRCANGRYPPNLRRNKTNRIAAV
jgi:hypothetical protein